MRSLRRFVVASSLVSGIAALVSGCGTNPEPTSVVCTDFRAGADLSSSTFGVTGDLQRPYVAFAQAAGDLSAVANQMLHDVGAACQGLAIELGADATDARVRDKTETDAVRAWCKIAAERFTSVRPRLEKAHFVVQVATPKCTTDTGFQLACEQRCLSGKAACTEATPEERCPVDGREGICPGECTGTCTGSESATAACEGTCSGTCFGTCRAEGKGDEGKGDDDATDCSGGCACTQICKGTCTAACALTQGGGHCDAVCAGKCSEPMVAQTCTKPLAPPTCGGDVDCQKSCSASGAARASCPDGSLAVVLDAAARTDMETARIASALERHLPAVFLAARGRAKVLADGASDILDSAGHILTHADQLGPMGAACGMLIGETGDEARKNLNAALGGSQDLAHAVTGDTVAPPAKD
jgi:hypothetical protein